MAKAFASWPRSTLLPGTWWAALFPLSPNTSGPHISSLTGVSLPKCPRSSPVISQPTGRGIHTGISSSDKSLFWPVHPRKDKHWSGGPLHHIHLPVTLNYPAKHPKKNKCVSITTTTPPPLPQQPTCLFGVDQGEVPAGSFWQLWTKDCLWGTCHSITEWHVPPPPHLSSHALTLLCTHQRALKTGPWDHVCTHPHISESTEHLGLRPQSWAQPGTSLRCKTLTLVSAACADVCEWPPNIINSRRCFHRTQSAGITLLCIYIPGR